MHTTIECTKMLFSGGLGLAPKEDAIQNYLYQLAKELKERQGCIIQTQLKGCSKQVRNDPYTLNRPNCKCTYLQANQRHCHCQCFIRHTEQFLTEMCCMTDIKARVAEPSLFQGLAS